MSPSGSEPSIPAELRISQIAREPADINGPLGRKHVLRWAATSAAQADIEASDLDLGEADAGRREDVVDQRSRHAVGLESVRPGGRAGGVRGVDILARD